MTNAEFTKLVNIASQALKYPALKFTENQKEARLLIQKTIKKALENRTKYSTGTNIKAWLYIIMKNTFINQSIKTDSKSQDFTTGVSNIEGAVNSAIGTFNKAMNKLKLSL